jgi:hypothetical protein
MFGVGQTSIYDPQKTEQENIEYKFILKDALNVQAKNYGPRNQRQIDSLRGIVELANAGQLCTQASGKSIEFKWNPQKAYSTEFLELVKKN